MMNDSLKKIVTDLRAMADALESIEAPRAFASNNSSVNIILNSADELRTAMRIVGGAWSKDSIGSHFVTRRKFGDGYVALMLAHEAVCEKRIVTKTIPARERVVIEAQPERTEEVVEWRCPRSFLNPEPTDESAPDAFDGERNPATDTRIVSVG